MTIKVGDKLPQATFRVMTADGPAAEDHRTTCSRASKVVLFAVPGAFTPTCHKNHLPGYLNKAGRDQGRGRRRHHGDRRQRRSSSLDAWAKATGGAGVMEFLSDGNADFAKEIGLSLDGSGFGLGTRSHRYSMLVEDGMVTALNIEDAPGKADVSGAEAMLGQI